MGRTVSRAALAVVPDVEPADGELVEELTADEAEAITAETGRDSGGLQEAQHAMNLGATPAARTSRTRSDGHYRATKLHSRAHAPRPVQGPPPNVRFLALRIGKARSLRLDEIDPWTWELGLVEWAVK